MSLDPRELTATFDKFHDLLGRHIDDRRDKRYRFLRRHIFRILHHYLRIDEERLRFDADRKLASVAVVDTAARRLELIFAHAHVVELIRQIIAHDNLEPCQAPDSHDQEEDQKGYQLIYSSVYLYI